MSGAPVFVASAQGVPLDHLPLVARGRWLAFLGPHGIVATLETILGRLPPPELQTVNWDTLPGFSVKKVLILVLELQPEGQASGLAHILWPTELFSRTVGCELP